MTATQISVILTSSSCKIRINSGETVFGINTTERGLGFSRWRYWEIKSPYLPAPIYINIIIIL